MTTKTPIVAVLLAIFTLSASAAQFPITKSISVRGAETGRSYNLVAFDGLSLQVVNQGENETKIHLFDFDGKKRPGAFHISNRDLEVVLGRSFQHGLRTAAEGPQRPCATCGVSAPPSDETLEPGRLPALPAAQAVRGRCDMYDKFRSNGVPAAPLKQALFYYEQNRSKFGSNPRYISIADYSQHSARNRFYLLDMETGQTVATQVSHGGGDGAGDPNHDGYLDRCQHPNGSRRNMTRVGFFKTNGLYASKKGWPRIAGRANGMNMIGLSGPNARAMGDGVVMHEAHYNRSGATLGRSWGCPAFIPGKGGPIMRKITGGSLFYAYAPVCASDMRQVLSQVQGWENYCSTK